MSEYKFPTEIIKLPSQGLPYPENNPLSNGEIELKYMTAYHEDILTNINYIQQGIVLDKLLQSLIVSKINYDDLLLCDKEALLLASRVLGYGKDYAFQTRNPHTQESSKITIDLTTIKEKEIDLNIFKKGINEFKFELPITNNMLTFKLLNVGDNKMIEAEIKGLKKINPSASHDLTTTLKFMIMAVGDVRDKKSIREFVDQAFLARDRKEFSGYIKRITPGIELKASYDFGNGDEEVTVPIDISFFWPE